MAHTIDEYRKDRESDDKAVERKAARINQAQMMRQAAVRASELTGHPAWDLFLSYIQAAVEEGERQREEFMAIMQNPTVINDDDMTRAKVSLIEINATMKAWRAVMELPKDLIESGVEAESLLARLNREEQNS